MYGLKQKKYFEPGLEKGLVSCLLRKNIRRRKTAEYLLELLCQRNSINIFKLVAKNHMSFNFVLHKMKQITLSKRILNYQKS